MKCYTSCRNVAIAADTSVTGWGSTLQNYVFGKTGVIDFAGSGAVHMVRLCAVRASLGILLSF